MEISEIYRKAIKQANEALDEKQFTKALIKLMEISDVCPQAALEVFNIFIRGGYIEQACFYLNLAAAQGYEPANVILGKHLADGIYFERDEKRAVEILSQYPQNASALCGLGYIYLAGVQIPRDPHKAINCLVKSAEMGYSQASYNIALICAGETGLEYNERQMFDWLATAMSQGSGAACFYAARRYAELGRMNESYNCIVRGVQLGHAGCIEVYPRIRQQIMGSSGAYHSGIRQSHFNEAEFSYTGQAEMVRRTEEKRLERIERSRGALDAAAAYSGGGFVNYETGFGIDKDGNSFSVDEMGGITTAQGAMMYDKENRILMHNDGLVYFDEDMKSMYDSQKKKWSYINRS